MMSSVQKHKNNSRFSLGNPAGVQLDIPGVTSSFYSSTEISALTYIHVLNRIEFTNMESG